MPHHTVTLNYGSNGFKASPDPVRVRPGDTISFQLEAAPPKSKLKVKMHDPAFFSAGEVDNSQARIEVLRAASTKYHCQLFDSHGKQLGESHENTPGGSTGGGIEPEG
ncbi:MAG: hypothetical protein M3Z36_09110 [Acidobacteriota bacterium]|nr:hypothetical protein [Acidobacteriota bacterium]